MHFHGRVVELSGFSYLRRLWTSIDGVVRLRAARDAERPELADADHGPRVADRAVDRAPRSSSTRCAAGGPQTAAKAARAHITRALERLHDEDQPVIERTEVLVLTHRLSRTRIFGTGSNVTRDSVVVRLEDGDGLVGWGETYLVPGAVEAARAMTDGGRRADAGRGRGRADGADPDAHRWALGAVSMALDDLRARGPRHPRLGPVRRRAAARTVRAYASSRGYLGGLSPESAWTDEAATSWDDGFRAMKLRIGKYPVDEEIEAIERVVAASPPMTWMADGNGAYDMADSRRLGRGARRSSASAGSRSRCRPTTTWPMRRWRASCRSRWPAARSSNRPTTPSRTCGPARSTSSSPTSRSAAGSAASSRSRRPPATPAGSRSRTPAAARSRSRRPSTSWPSCRSRPTRPKWAEPILEHDVGENPIRTDHPDRAADARRRLDDDPRRARASGSTSTRWPSAAWWHDRTTDDARRSPRRRSMRTSPS